MHFFHPIQQSAPHTYHSALPLSPSSPILRSTFFREKTLITRFFGRPDNWGSVIRTIKGTVGRFTCMTTIGRRIAAACDDGTVSIYDSVTGVLRLSLNPEHPVELVTGSPDGSILFCAHQWKPSVTLWDVQTGGLIHTFMLGSHVENTAISLEGRYLACGLLDGSVHVWEVATRTECPPFGDGFPVMHLRWLAPEEQLVVVNLASLCIWDVVTGKTLYTLRMLDQVWGTAYSQKLNQLAVATTWGGGRASSPPLTLVRVYLQLRLGSNNGSPASHSLKPPKSLCVVCGPTDYSCSMFQRRDGSSLTTQSQ